MRVLPALFNCCVTVLALARAVDAQPSAPIVTSPLPGLAHHGACGADSMFVRAPVFVHVRTDSRVTEEASRSMGIIAQEVATRVRAMLGNPDALAPIDSVLAPFPPATGPDSTGPARAPRGMDREGVRVVARRDGAFRWAPVRTTPSPVTALLDRALLDAKRTGDLLLLPEAFTSDSIAFTLQYTYGVEDRAGRLLPLVYGPATLTVFTLRAPFVIQAAVVPGTLRARYPETALHGGAEGVVNLEFVVDTTGRAVEGTIHDVWPKDRPRLTGSLGDHYQAFVNAATRGVLDARFSPAEIAGCKVKQLVRLPIDWKITR